MTVASFFEKVFNNWQAKILSFGLAVLLYAAFQIISLDTKSFSIPLQIRAEGNYVLSEAAPNTVRIDLQGKAEDIAVVQESNIRAFIDISHVSEPGQIIFDVDLELSDSLTMLDTLDVRVTPASLSLSCEERWISWVPVEPRFKGKPLDGYEVASWESSFADVRVVGARSIVDSTNTIFADAVDLNDKSSSFSVEANLEAVSEKIRILTSDVTTIHVEIVPQIISMQYENILPATSSLSPEFTLLQPLPFLSARLTGEKNPLTNFTPNDTFAVVDFSQITEVGVYTLPITINIPTGFTLDEVSLFEVEVEVIDAPIVAEEDLLIEVSEDFPSAASGIAPLLEVLQ